jgi:hypothetical protein
MTLAQKNPEGAWIAVQAITILFASSPDTDRSTANALLGEGQLLETLAEVFAWVDDDARLQRDFREEPNQSVALMAGHLVFTLALKRGQAGAFYQQCVRSKDKQQRQQSVALIRASWVP